VGHNIEIPKSFSAFSKGHGPRFFIKLVSIYLIISKTRNRLSKMLDFKSNFSKISKLSSNFAKFLILKFLPLKTLSMVKNLNFLFICNKFYSNLLILNFFLSIRRPSTKNPLGKSRIKISKICSDNL
jgi:hypothetical protein